MNVVKVSKGLAVAALISASSLASAHEAGDWLFRIGGSNVDPKSNNSPLVSVDDGASATFTFTYMYTDNLAVEVLAAWPFKHDINLVGGPKVASTKHLPPTVSLQYHFLPQSVFQPYVGVGVNYTYFFDEKTSGALEGTKLSLSDSWGFAGQVGFDFMLNEKWFLNVDARYIQIDTDAKLDGAPLGKVTIDPWVYGAHVGFRF
ncbi:MAG: OmpW family outer membrane protein [Gammaproteobacteria bacterium]